MANVKKVEIEIEVPELDVHRTRYGRYKFIYDKENNEIYVNLMMSEFNPIIEHNRAMIGYCYMKDDEDGVESFAEDIADLQELKSILEAGAII